MCKPFFFIAFASLCTSECVFAQEAENNYSQKASVIVNEFTENLKTIKETISESATDKNANLSPYTYQILTPGTYYGSAMSNQLKLDYRPSSSNIGSESSLSQGMTYRDALTDEISTILSSTYLNNPNIISYHDKQIMSEEIVKQAKVVKAKEEDLATIYKQVKQIDDVKDVVSDVDIDLQIEKPNFWTTSGRFTLQFTQNYFSEKWYKGGDNNVTMFSNLVLEANYNDQRNIQWDNKLDARLGYITTKSDQYHKYLSNNDKLALYSKLGVKATKAWLYTLSVEANTQFLPGYRANDKKRYSDFMAPLDVFTSLGMDYKPSLKKGNSLSMALFPLSYKMRYINSDDENIHNAYHLKEHFKQDFGSKVELNAKIAIAKNLTWRSRFYYFTSYEYAEGEFENQFSFQFNKYFSTELNTLWRFDDNRAPSFKDYNLGYFQFKEYFTLGLSYNF